VLTDPDAMDVKKRDPSNAQPARREPRDLLEILLPETG
jgi:hypothetical protein